MTRAEIVKYIEEVNESKNNSKLVQSYMRECGYTRAEAIVAVGELRNF